MWNFRKGKYISNFFEDRLSFIVKTVDITFGVAPQNWTKNLTYKLIAYRGFHAIKLKDFKNI